MPFVAECILCSQKVRVPDRADGASVQCPRCGSYFTAARVDSLFPAAKTSTPVAAPPVAQPAVAPAPLPARPIATPGEAAVDTEPGAALTPLPPAPQPLLNIPVNLETPRGARRWFDPVGITALMLSGIAGWCTVSYALAFLVIPLAALGLLVGVAGVFVAIVSEAFHYGVATAGAVVSAVLLFVAVLFPAMLGPNYEMSRARVAHEPATPRAVALPGKAAAADASNTAEWTDAGRYALQVKKVRVEVVSAVVRPIEIATQPKKKLSKESYLVLRVRIHEPAGGAEFAANSWPQQGPAKERPRPKLTDASGKTYGPPRDVGGEAGALTQKSDLFPLGITDEVYVFEAPPPGVELRLEIPAEPWGGTGVLRFAIPPSMREGAAATVKDKRK